MHLQLRRSDSWYVSNGLYTVLKSYFRCSIAGFVLYNKNDSIKRALKLEFNDAIIWRKKLMFIFKGFNAKLP